VVDKSVLATHTRTRREHDRSWSFRFRYSDMDAKANVSVKEEDSHRSGVGDIDRESTPEKENKMKIPNPIEWLPALINSKHFFQTCTKCSQERTLSSGEVHKAMVNYLCLTCADVTGICQLCMHKHANHHILQIRRSSHDVVREQELSKLINTEGIQTYIINSSQVVFLRERPQSRNKSSASVPKGHNNRNAEKHPEGGCLTCGRHLHEGLSYCSLGCKVKYCTRGEPLGKKLPPGLELTNKPQGANYWVSFQPHTPQLKPKLSSYSNKRKKHTFDTQTPIKSETGYKSHLHYYGNSPHQIFHRHRRKKFRPRQSPCA